jgi:membrane associated rhomboid family serine protease
MIVPVKAKWFVVIIGVIEFFSSFSSGSGISHFAHLGGLLFGYLFMRGAALPFRWRLSYQDWRRAQTRKKFEVYMRDHEKKDNHGRWVN